mmetsp:Transcript_25547/g.44576  ORF Transcript_25547/g.44576 Transcript_25547/m.44576 type:complete len:538 (+) Transcript_25547:4912-6525(+)
MPTTSFSFDARTDLPHPPLRNIDIFMTRDRVAVYVRVRPLLDYEDSERCIRLTDSETLQLKRGLGQYSMNFDRVLDEDTSQATLFGCVRPAVEDFFAGVNCTVMAYGQTGSGKTHTIFGTEEAGLLPRILEEVFVQPGRKQLYVSMMEVYRDKLYDLLQKTQSPLQIKENASSQALIPELLVVPVSSAQQASNYLSLGLRQRRAKESALSHRSSRSHCIFQLLQVKDETVTMMRVVDLAGSERLVVSKSMKPLDKKEHIAEVNFINKSLTTLGQCINALTQAGRSHVPYRDSKLTRVLKDSLELDSSVILVVCVSASITCLTESLSTLNFADRAKQAILTEKAPPKTHTMKEALEKERKLRLALESRLEAAETELSKLRQQNQELERNVRSKDKNVRWLADEYPELVDYDRHNELFNQSGLFKNLSWLAEDSKEEFKQTPEADKLDSIGTYEATEDEFSFASLEANLLQDTPRVDPKPFGTLKSEVLSEARVALEKLQAQHEVTDSLCRIVDMLETDSSSASIAQRCWREFSDLLAD